MWETTGQASLIAVVAFVISLVVLFAFKTQHLLEVQLDEDRHTTAAKVDSDVQHSSIQQVQEKPDDAITRYTFWIAVLTAVLAIATVGLVVATVGLWSFAAEQARDMKAAIGQSRRAADAARDAVDLARENMQHQLRAYVSLRQVIEEQNADQNGVPTGWLFSPEWENTGATPTRNLSVWAVGRFFTPDVPEDFDFPEPDLPGSFTGVIGAGQTLRTGRIFIPMADIVAAQNEKGKIYMDRS